ncbi:MAG: glucose-1-phosphate thymidylyltransferase RfbA [Candidatus Omnitrophica bacterium]|nr:glucose-1-phosphate thymidylyltransferase RfbA [Candidatus Omnitrophota bacterium]
MKGIILAGGRATRLYPVTKSTCKQMLPVYDKPMIYYPLSVLMLAGIRDVLVISTPVDLPRFRELLGTGEELGIRISYEVQPKPGGIAEAFIVGEKFIAGEDVCLILGDNIFFGHGLTELLQQAAESTDQAVIFGYYTKEPQRYGVVEFDQDQNVLSIEEKPDLPRSNYAVCGLYFYPNDVVGISKKIEPSSRGELEITDINNVYLREGRLRVKTLGRGFAWLDTGTHDSLLDGSYFIKTVEERQGLKIGCIEEVAYRMGYIDQEQLKRLAGRMNSSYGRYLIEVINEESSESAGLMERGGN